MKKLMKKTILLFLCLCITLITQAITVVSTKGGLSTAITSAGGTLSTVNELTVTGTIDARDFKMMRDSMPVLAVIDLSGVYIAAYTGTDGTYNTNSTAYLINTLPQYAFCNTSHNGKASLTSVILPASITNIGDWAFRKCIGLTSITIPPLVTSIGIWAFGTCSGLTSVTISSSVTSIGNYAFCTCSSLTSVTISEGVTTIGRSAFDGCRVLTSVNIPSSVTSIGESAFYDCSGIITVDSDNPEYSSIDGVLFNKLRTILIQCPISKTGAYTIPSSVTSIGGYAFWYCNGLTSVTIPSSVTSIGTGTFNFCSGLTTIYANSSTPIDLSSSSIYFFGVDTTTCILHVPIGSKAAYQVAPQWLKFTNVVEDLPAKVKVTTISNLKIYVQNGYAIVSGVPIGETISIYNLQGTATYNQQANTKTVSIGLPARGMYVVRVGKQSMKIVN